MNIRIFDVMGREVGVVFQGMKAAGSYSAEYNTQKLSQGVNCCRLVASAEGYDVVQTQKLVKVQYQVFPRS